MAQWLKECKTWNWGVAGLRLTGFIQYTVLRTPHHLQMAKNCKELPSMQRVMFCLFVWFDSLRPINNLSVIKGLVFLGWTSTIKARINALAQGHKAVMPMRLEPAAPRSRVKHSTTEPLHTLKSYVWVSESIINLKNILLFFCFDSLCPCQQSFSYIQKGLRWLNQY